MIKDEKTNMAEIEESQIINLDFFLSMKESVTCSICTSIISQPKMCSQCETPYCQECIDQWFSKNKICPMRCESSKILEINRSLKRIYDAVKVKCIEGCEVTLLEYRSHIPKCEKRKIQCWNCKSLCKAVDAKVPSEIEFIKLKEENQKLREQLKAALQSPSRLVNNTIYINGQNSLIDANLYQKLKAWISGSSTLKLDLIYKASRDGFEAADFHRKCDNKGMTVVVMKTSYNKIIGGFTVLGWTSPPTNGIFYKDSSLKSFLFSGSLGECYSLRDAGKFAICCNRNYGPIFGHYDLLVVTKNNVNNTGNFDIGDCYDYNRPKEEFYGGTPYRVLELEVFKVDIV